MVNRKPTYQRKNSLRLQGYDYSSEGVYFITIVTKNRASYFGEVIHDKVLLSESGKIVAEEWKKTPLIRKEVLLGEWVIMPDHFHALVAFKGSAEIASSSSVSAHCNAPVRDNNSYKNSFSPQVNSLSSIVRGFKASCTRRIRKEIEPSFGWHRSFHDRIVRSQKELKRIEDYIFENPLKFSLTNNSTIN